MAHRDALDEIVQNKYKELSAQLGDCHFQITKIQQNIKKLEEEIETLNSAYPLAIATIEKIKLEESKDDEQSGN